jgi:hypothetical protein
MGCRKHSAALDDVSIRSDETVFRDEHTTRELAFVCGHVTAQEQYPAGETFEDFFSRQLASGDPSARRSRRGRTLTLKGGDREKQSRQQHRLDEMLQAISRIRVVLAQGSPTSHSLERSEPAQKGR